MTNFKNEFDKFNEWVAEELEKNPLGYEPPAALETLGRVLWLLQQQHEADAQEALRDWLYSYENAGTPDLPDNYPNKLALRKAIIDLDNSL
jgi:hypothetical protein